MQIFPSQPLNLSNKFFGLFHIISFLIFYYFRNDGTVITNFEPTPSTPTYLIAYIVSDFEYVSNEANTAQDFPQRVYAQKNIVENGHFSVDTGFKILRRLEEYLQVNFSLPKMDQAAVPDFSAGAMENWGLVTYR